MPELKNSFTGGKMNKDLDERIIPSTDYREALNIGVATSEDSDVGAAQNILGNTRVSCAIQGPGNKYLEASKHITAVADHQNDKIYRFIHTPGELPSSNPSGVWMDRIVEFDVNKPLNATCEEKEKAVMIDIYQVETTIDNVQSECPDGPVTISVSGNVFQLRWGMLVVGGGLTALDGVTVLSVTWTSTSTANLLLSADNDGNNPTVTTGNIMLEADRVLNFSPDRFITGVNILDGMIFWTDNYSEPKKVNIERGIAGSLMTHELSNYQYKSFDQHTKLVVNDTNPTECTKISPNSCEEEGKIYGCTDPLALNYDPVANSEDGSCVHAEGDACVSPEWINFPWGDPAGGTNYSGYKYDYCDRCAATSSFTITFPHTNGMMQSTSPTMGGIDYCSCCPPPPAPLPCGGAAQIPMWAIYGYEGTIGGGFCSWWPQANITSFVIPPTYHYTSNNPWSTVVGRDIIKLYSMADVIIWFNAIGNHIQTYPWATSSSAVQWDPNLYLHQNLERFHDEAGLDERFLMGGGPTMVCP